MSNDFDKPKAVSLSAKPQQQPLLVRQVRDNALSTLLSQIDQLFSRCDDLFFDLSSHATSNSDQNSYFESMRELRVQKSGIIASFKQRIEQQFVDCAKLADVATEPAHSSEPLSLVQEDDIEQRVAIEGMTSKARGNNQEALYHLNMRLDLLVAGSIISDKNNPLDPRQLCQNFARACELLRINIKTKIILYKQFDRLIVNALPKLYASANELLIDAGIMPSIKHSASKEQHNVDSDATQRRQQHHGAQEQTTPPLTNGERPAFDQQALNQLLHSMQALGLNTIPHYQPFSSNPGPTMSNEQLLTTLGLLQAQLLLERSNDTSTHKENSVRDIVSDILKQSNPAVPQAVKQPAEDAINLVAMFFDFILDDQTLPLPFQALLGRLQIPILKTALRDATFFSDHHHPARKLVNELAAACIGWGSDETRDSEENIQRDKAYQFIAATIADINEHSADNDHIYTQKLAELQQFVDRNNHRNTLIEKRTHQAAEGQARTKQAREAAREELFALMERAQLPPVITDFLITQWQQFITLTHLKHGEESAEWLDAVQLAQDVIWLCRPQQDEKSRARFEKIQAGLFIRVRQGLTQVINTDDEVQALSEQIKNAINHLQTQYRESSSISDILQPLNAEQAKLLGHSAEGSEKSWKNMTALERQQARYQSLTYEFIKQAEAIAINSWMLYHDPKQERSIKCKLVGKIEASDSFIFVDRFGFNVLEKARREFAYDLQQERVTLLDSGLLFDRAMSSIASNIRHLSGGQTHS